MEDGGGVRDQKVVGIEDSLAQMTIGGGRVRQRQEEGFTALSSLPPMPASIEVLSVLYSFFLMTRVNLFDS